MNLPLISLAALFITIALSYFSRINVGLLALAFSWVVGSYLGGLKMSDVVSAFPLSLFIVLFGVTFLFGLAKINGTLDQVVHWALHLARGRTMLLPIYFFIFALILAFVGPGNIGAIALLAPLAMAVAGKIGIGAFFMTVMLVNGANAGTLSPFALTGIIAGQLTDKIGLNMNPWTQIFLPNLIAQSFIALCSYLIFAAMLGKKNFVSHRFLSHEIAGFREPFTSNQNMTLLILCALMMGVVFFKADIGFLAITLAAFLSLFNGTDSEEAMKIVPWNTIMMVCGVSSLTSILEKTGGLELFTSLLSKISTPRTVTGVMAFVAGVISSFSSSSGVVLPAFIPIVPGLIEKLSGGNPEAIVSAITVGSHVVDVSPLSTLGALCLANAVGSPNKKKLFNQLMLYGLSMSVLGAIVCYLFFGLWGKYLFYN